MPFTRYSQLFSEFWIIGAGGTLPIGLGLGKALGIGTGTGPKWGPRDRRLGRPNKKALSGDDAGTDERVALRKAFQDKGF
jgi:hypothetical protein